jgi:SAM-dependent methyltransferase
VRGSGQALPCADHTFDAVVCTFPTDFITQAAAMRELARVLADDGVLVVVPSAAFTGGGLLRRALDWAYRATGQGSVSEIVAAQRAELEMHLRAWFTPYFEARLHLEPAPRSQVLVLVARKAVRLTGTGEGGQVAPSRPREPVL